MKPIDILIIAHFSGPTHASNDRFRELARILSKRGATIELATSSFVHESKTQRDPSVELAEPFRTTYIPEPDYSANVSVGRILSHRAMSRNLVEYLNQREVPDVIYCAMPSNDVAAVVAAYAKQHGVRFVLDVQDLWPEAFELVLKPKRLARYALTPLRSHADRIYRAADAVVTVSDTYSERVRSSRSGDVSTTYLGTNLKSFDRHEAKSWDASDKAIQLAYIGTLSHSYDLPVVFEAIRILKRQHYEVRLHLMGAGPLAEKWRESTQDLRDEVLFHGLLSYPEMVARLRSCDIALNPIVPGAAQSIVNKVCDYAAAGLPVVSTQECEEYRNMLVEFNAGINCAPEPTAVASALIQLADNQKIRQEMGHGSRRLAEEHFDRAVTYERLADLVVNHAS
ncbi:glycosyltransferase family 4 protein [Corynebacterium sp. A21]|uniref:glycosyltransferase family 4 protein n=1 Tax=Corynebacterium sp. A21 TaxID=3457318 RepID=UPI003FCFEA1C